MRRLLLGALLLVGGCARYVPLVDSDASSRDRSGSPDLLRADRALLDGALDGSRKDAPRLDLGSPDHPGTLDQPRPKLDTTGCNLSGLPPTAWEKLAFSGTTPTTSCTGERYVRFHPRYELWVGAILCGSPTQYKLLLSTSKTGVYLAIGDDGGHGQDHCELVNPAFTIPVDDDIQSGCPTCAEGPSLTGDPGFGSGWTRSHFGECFTAMPVWESGSHTMEWQSCGMPIP